jgi:hypothetical protein
MQQSNHDSLPDALPPNSAIGWYRFVLWLMPTCVAYTAAIAMTWLDHWHTEVLLLVTVSSTAAIGIFEARLRIASGRLAVENRPVAVLRFVLFQVFIIPALICFIALILFVAGGCKLGLKC